jgi:hypothetical protein
MGKNSWLDIELLQSFYPHGSFFATDLPQAKPSPTAGIGDVFVDCQLPIVCLVFVNVLKRVMLVDKALLFAFLKFNGASLVHRSNDFPLAIELAAARVKRRASSCNDDRIRSGKIHKRLGQSRTVAEGYRQSTISLEWDSSR